MTKPVREKLTKAQRLKHDVLRALADGEARTVSDLIIGCLDHSEREIERAASTLRDEGLLRRFVDNYRITDAGLSALQGESQ